VLAGAAGQADAAVLKRAAQVLGAVSAWLGDLPSTAEPGSRLGYERACNGLRAALGDAVFTEAWAAGQAQGRDRPQAGARTARPRVPGDPTPRGPAEPPAPAGAAASARRLTPGEATKPEPALTARETEILRLVASAFSDGQIAERLILSPRTVQAHVRAIYAKLNVGNRSAATRYAIEHGLL
jgi:DNA-binding CsgD family transcriptional regulator